MKKTELEIRKEILQGYLDSDNKDLINTLWDLLTVTTAPTKNNMLEFAGFDKDQQRKFDNAIPSPYADKIKEIYPNFNGLNHAYNYNEKSFGEMFNVVEAFGTAVISRLYHKF